MALTEQLYGCSVGSCDLLEAERAEQLEHYCSFFPHKCLHASFCPQRGNAKMQRTHDKTCHPLTLHSAALFAQAAPGSIYGPSRWRQGFAVAWGYHSEEPAGSLE